ncbi:MAG TPA: hypothetical protein VFP59_20405 [Candidatus Angelobacter sp.]|nr:hypothetical protein [Candidatus Angelobacter sp.]
MILLVMSAACLLVTFLIRLVPSIQDVISGRTEYMPYIANQVAESLAAQEHGQEPIIVAAQVKQDCRTIPTTDKFNDQQLYFVITYTEQAHSFCITEYALPQGRQPQDSITLSEEIGRNYGAPLLGPVPVVPIGHLFKVLPDFIIDMMNPRKSLNRSGATISFDSHTSASFSVPTTDGGLNLNLFTIRDLLAAKYAKTNRLLNWVLLVFSLSGSGLIVWIAKQYARFERHCLAYGYTLPLQHYLRADLDALSTRLRQEHLEGLQKLRAQDRAESLARREHNVLRERLLALRELSRDELQKQQIDICLRDNQVEEMRNLVRSVEVRTEASPEERLRQLLESVKDYSDEEEWERFRAKAMSICENLGFRTAREFVVQLRDELKALARLQEMKESGAVTEEN